MATTTHGTREIPKEMREYILDEWYLDTTTPKMYYKNKKGDLETTVFIAKEGEGRWTSVRFIRCPGMKERKFVSIISPTKTKGARERVREQVLSKMTKLYRKGWCFTEEEALDVKETDVCKPMLYHKFEDCPDKLKYPIIGQPKYDGFRCIWNPDEGKLVTRGGKTFNLPHISEALKSIAASWLDGEICFEEPQPLGFVNEQISRKNENLKFMVWDVGMDTDLSYKERLAILLSYRSALEKTDVVQVVPSFVINDPHEAHSRWEQWTSEGYEGIMLKNLDAQYKWDSRVTEHLKYKLTFDITTKIESITSDDTDRGPMISFNCESAIGTQKITPRWLHSERLKMYKELHRFGAFFKDIPVDIQHRGITKDGKYIHAVIISDYNEVMDALKAKVSGA